jgi:hypothetical protein
MSNPKQKEVFILIFCLLLGFALRFYTFDQKSLWLDEIYTFQDSRDGFNDQLKFYKENPSYLQAPLFFLLTHQFYPFTKPERDLRIIPLIFGTLSIPMFFFLAKTFSPDIALPCAISLTFMTYHISLSQDGRAYSLLLFLGMTGLHFFMKHLQTSKKGYLVMVALFFSILFYTSYSSIAFIVFSQVLWFYRLSEGQSRPRFSSFLILNGLIFLFCLPWLLFLVTHLKGGPLIAPLHTEDPGSILSILYGVLQDWTSGAVLMIISVILLIFFLVFSKSRRNAFVLLAVFVLPIGGFYLFCKLFDFTHFVTSKYLINFLPLFLITLFLSASAIKLNERLKGFLRLRLLLIILFIAQNLIILPLYYHSEKQDFRGLVRYLTVHVQEDDKIIVGTRMYFQGLLHYFGIDAPKNREYMLHNRKVSENENEYFIPLVYEGKIFTISHSRTYWTRYIAEGNRVWFVLDKKTAKEMQKNYPFTLKGYFDGSFLNLIRFPTDVSMYLLLWDPKSPWEKGIDLPIE